MIATISVGTQTDPLIWESLLDTDPAMFATVLEVIRERANG